MSVLERMFPMLCMAAAIMLAYLCPWLACSYCNAPLHPELTVWWGVIPGIFFVEGLLLPTQAMRKASNEVRKHIAIQCFNFVLMPGMTVLICTGLHQASLLPEGLLFGFLAFSAVPTTTSMNVMHTNLASGNAALAAFNAVLGNTLAIVLSPILLLMVRYKSESVDHEDLLISFFGKMLLPLIVGQLMQVQIMPAAHTVALRINQGLIVLLLLQIFSDVFYHGSELPASWLWISICVSVALHGVFLSLAWMMSGLPVLKASAGDRVAMLYCSTQKTVVLGLPLLRFCLWERSSTELVFLSFPLISYHLLQLVVGVALSGRLRAYVQQQTLNTSQLSEPFIKE